MRYAMGPKDALINLLDAKMRLSVGARQQELRTPDQ